MVQVFLASWKELCECMRGSHCVLNFPLTTPLTPLLLSPPPDYSEPPITNLPPPPIYIPLTLYSEDLVLSGGILKDHLTIKILYVVSTYSAYVPTENTQVHTV